MTIRTALIAAAFAAVAFTGTADAANRHVRIYNNTDVDMQEFYASNSRTNDWQEDIFGSRVLPAHSSVDVNIDDGTGACMYDFKAVFADGDVLVRNSINVCRVSSYTYSSR